MYWPIGNVFTTLADCADLHSQIVFTVKRVQYNGSWSTQINYVNWNIMLTAITAIGCVDLRWSRWACCRNRPGPAVPVSPSLPVSAAWCTSVWTQNIQWLASCTAVSARNIHSEFAWCTLCEHRIFTMISFMHSCISQKHPHRFCSMYICVNTKHSLWPGLMDVCANRKDSQRLRFTYLCINTEHFLSICSVCSCLNS